MKYIFFFLLAFFLTFKMTTGRTGLGSAPFIIRDTVPNGVPQLFAGKYYQFKGYVLIDSLLLMPCADTNFLPTKPALVYKCSDSTFYLWALNRWKRILRQGDVEAIDTAAMLANYIRDGGYGLVKVGQLLRADTSATGLATQYDLSQIVSGINQLTGDVTAGPGTGSQVATIATNAVTNTKLAQMPGLSVKSNPTNATANAQDVVAASDNQVYRRSGTTLGFGAVNLPSPNAVTGQLLNANLAPFKTYPAEKSLGIIYEKSQWSDISADLLPNPSGSNTLSISTGYLNSSASSFSYNNYVRILPGRPTDMNRWKMTVRFRNTSFSANSFEFGVGIYSAVTHSGAQFGYIAFLQSTSSGSGNLFIYDQSGSTQRATGSGAVTYSLNDDIELTYTYNDSVLTFTAQNITTGGTLRTATYTFPSNMSVILPNNGNWGLFEGNGGSGTHQVRYIKIESLETQNPNLLIIGNSKTKGYFADNYGSRFSPQLNITYPTVVWNAGSAERITDMLTRIDEFTQLNPSQVILADIASNQLRAGTAFADVIAMYEQIVKIFEAGGTQVFHLVLPEDSTGGGLGQTAWNAWLAARYPSTYINTYAAMSSGNIGLASMLNADKIHPNQTGNNTIVSTIISSGLISTISTQRRTPYRTNDDVVKFTGDSLFFKWRVRSRGNYVPRWSTNLDELTVGPMYMDSTDIIISSSTRPAKPLSALKVSIEGANGWYGTQGGWYLFDRTNSSNYHYAYSNNNFLRFGYVGTDNIYINTIGAAKFGNSGSAGETVTGMLQTKKNQTLAAFQSVLGVNLNIDTSVITTPATSTSFYASNSFGFSTLTAASAANATTATNVFIDTLAAGANFTIIGNKRSLTLGGRLAIGKVDSATTATGGYLYKDFSTGEVRMTAATADGNGIYSGSGALQSGTTNVTGGGVSDLNLGTTGSKIVNFAVNTSLITTLQAGTYVQLFGGVQFSNQTATDANFTAADNASYITLPAITASRNFTLPSQGSGKYYIIHNKNASGNAWNVVGNLVDAAGAAITTITNSAFTIIISDGTNFIKMN